MNPRKGGLGREENARGAQGGRGRVKPRNDSPSRFSLFTDPPLSL